MRRLIFWTMLMAAAPASACVPPNVMFRPGSARVDAAGREDIDDVVRNYRALRVARVRLTAQADLNGPADANMRLARRRGNAVKAVLVRRGIPARAIDIVVEGEGSPSQPGQRIVWLDVVAPARDANTCS